MTTATKEHNVNPVTGRCVMCGRNGFQRRNAPVCDYGARIAQRLADSDSDTEHHDTPAAPERDTVINGDLFIQPLPNTTKFLLLTDADWPIAEVYTEAEAKQLRDEHNQHSTLIAQRERLLAIARDALRFREEMNGKCDHDQMMTKLCSQCEIRAAITTSEQERRR